MRLFTVEILWRYHLLNSIFANFVDVSVTARLSHVDVEHRAIGNRCECDFDGLTSANAV